MCNAQYNRARKILTERSAEVKKLAEKLISKESLELDELNELLGPSKRKNKADFSGYIQDLKKKKEEQAKKSTTDEKKPQ